MLSVKPDVRIIRRKDEVVDQPIFCQVSSIAENVVSIRVTTEVVIDTVLVIFVRILEVLPASTLFNCYSAAEKGTDQEGKARHTGNEIVLVYQIPVAR